MPRHSIAQQFKKFVADVHARRQALALLEQELAQITEAFGGAGIAVIQKSHPGPKPKALKGLMVGKKTGRRPRHFAMSGPQFILKIVSDAKQLTTAQINAQWKMSGRKGKANITLSKLFKAKKLVRVQNKGGRGSIYKVA